MNDFKVTGLDKVILNILEAAIIKTYQKCSEGDESSSFYREYVDASTSLAKFQRQIIVRNR